MLRSLVPGGTFLLNTPFSAEGSLGQAADAGAAELAGQEGEILRD